MLQVGNWIARFFKFAIVDVRKVQTGIEGPLEETRAGVEAAAVALADSGNEIGAAELLSNFSNAAAESTLAEYTAFFEWLIARWATFGLCLHGMLGYEQSAILGLSRILSFLPPLQIPRRLPDGRPRRSDHRHGSPLLSQMVAQVSGLLSADRCTSTRSRAGVGVRIDFRRCRGGYNGSTRTCHFGAILGLLPFQ